MESTPTDLYIGFEGEPEIVFSRLDSDLSTLRVWAGYFNAVMRAIPPGPDGRWQGILLPYHLHTGWYETTAYEIEDLSLFASQLEALDTSFFTEGTQSFYTLLLALVRDCVCHHQKLLIQYF